MKRKLRGLVDEQSFVARLIIEQRHLASETCKPPMYAILARVYNNVSSVQTFRTADGAAALQVRPHAVPISFVANAYAHLFV